MSAAAFAAVADAKPAVPLIQVGWGPEADDCIVAHELMGKLETLWRLSADAANEHVCDSYADRYRLAYMSYCVRLRALAVSLHADLRFAELREPAELDEFRDALMRKTRIDRENRSDTHRGPNVPGGSYTETWSEPSLRETQIVIDLREFDDDCAIPRVVEATVDGCGVTYTLESVGECGPQWARTLVATYGAAIS